MTFKIFNASEKNMKTLVDWANKEGWNPGLHDASVFYSIDASGFFVGEEDGQIIVTGSCVNYDDHFSFMGFYIVEPEYRGKGYGMLMTQALLDVAGNRLIGIDGVLKNITIYEKIGFKYYYENKRYASKAMKVTPSQNIIPLNEIPFEDLLTYDRQCFPAAREVFLRVWINQPDSLAMAYVDNGKLRGYAVRRRCVQGHKIGPLFADSPSIAQALYLALQHGIEGEELYLDIPERNEAAMALAQQYHMKYVFGCARMYNGPEPAIDHSKIFGITSYELG